MKTSKGFLCKLNKEDDFEVNELMTAHPLWKRTYARRMVSQRKFFREMEKLGNNKKQDTE